jgi:hypothetical protein
MTEEVEAILLEEVRGMHDELTGQGKTLAAMKAICEARPAHCAALFLKQSNGLQNGKRWYDPADFNPEDLREKRDLAEIIFGYRVVRWAIVIACGVGIAEGVRSLLI